MEKLYSNPIKCFTNRSEEAEYTYQPKGNTPFCVRISKSSWIPVNMMVFSDTSKNAIEEVKKAIKWHIKNYRHEEDLGHPDIISRPVKVKSLNDLLIDGKVEVQEIKVDQLFKIGWADNDTI